MIKIEENKRHSMCNSCMSKKSIKVIKVSATGAGWTTIMLCDKCINELVNRINFS